MMMMKMLTTTSMMITTVMVPVTMTLMRSIVFCFIDDGGEDNGGIGKRRGER